MNVLPPATVAGLGGRLTIDLGAIQRNWQALDSVSQGALTGAVVKADAYGLGIAAGRAGALRRRRAVLLRRDARRGARGPRRPARTRTSSSSTASSPAPPSSMPSSG